jgi:hypothetical protein
MGIFDQAALQKAIDAELDAVPTGHTKCLVGYYTTNGSFKIAYVQKVGENWLWGATLERDMTTGNIQGGIMVRGSWK